MSTLPNGMPEQHQPPNWRDLMPREDRAKICRHIMTKLASFYQNATEEFLKQRTHSFEAKTYTSSNSRDEYLNTIASCLTKIEEHVVNQQNQGNAGALNVPPIPALANQQQNLTINNNNMMIGTPLQTNLGSASVNGTPSNHPQQSNNPAVGNNAGANANGGANSNGPSPQQQAALLQQSLRTSNGLNVGDNNQPNNAAANGGATKCERKV